MPFAPKRRWFQWSLRTLFVVVTVAGVSIGWFRWNAIQVRERKEFITHLKALEHEPNPTTIWLMRWDRGDERIPLGWRLVGATNEDWGTWLLCNKSLTDTTLEQAKRLLPDCKIEVNPTPRSSPPATH